ncbi:MULTISPECIES: hypothetical protein [unclassified Streptomyces]|uniref:hypothetical protein n=1 Tax=unclassified Streptomyces TaxID=2593676 RepID=UPI002E1CC261|nr:hypothetical protein OG217_19540 [Streptomyces sp. NBC_01023]
MRTTSRLPQPGDTLRSWALLPSGDGGTAQSLAARPVPRSPRLPRAMDLVLTVVALLLAVVNSVQNPYMGPAAPWANLLMAAVSALPLLARRRVPELALAIGLLAKITVMTSTSQEEIGTAAQAITGLHIATVPEEPLAQPATLRPKGPSNSPFAVGPFGVQGERLGFRPG